MSLSARNRFIAHATIGYIVFGSAWIFFSDRLLLAFTDVAALTRLSTAKGIAFILLTALLLLLALCLIPDRADRQSSESAETSALIRSRERLPRWVAYCFALLVTVSMLLVRLAITVSFGERPLLVLFMLPIILSSVLGGFGPGLLATAVAALGIDYFGIPPLYSLGMQEPYDLFQWWMLIGSGILASYLNEHLHRARRQAEERRKLQEIAQEELRRSEERFQLAMRGANDGVWDWDLSTDEVYLSPQWINMLGYQPNELRHHFDTWKTLTHPDDRERTLGLVEALLAGKTDRLETEFRLRHHNGEYLNILSRAFPVKDDSGRIVRLVGTHVDVSARRRAERELRESEARLKLFIEHAPASLAMFDDHMRYLAVSRRWLDDYALGGRDLIGCSHYQMFPEIGEELKAVHRRALAGEVIRKEADRFKRADGSVQWLRWEVRPWFAADGVVGGIVIFSEDITRHKLAELEIHRLNAHLERRVAERTAELSAANSELESFTYAVSHDLRGPLRAMSGFSQALIEDYGNQLEGEARVYLEQIILGGRRMAELIDGLLTLSRSTRKQLQRNPVDLSAMARRLFAELAQQAPDRQVHLEIEPGLIVQGDAAMLELVMRNLLDNAWKYSSKRDTAAIRVFSRTTETHHFICVEDNGAGFDMAHAAQLFQPFQRLHRQEEFPGIGIGLATVQRIIHRHGGILEAKGYKDQGATLCFSLPHCSEDQGENT